MNLKPVFDIADVGPRNRFTIVTSLGYLVVHNCGFGGGKGAFQTMAINYQLKVTDDEADELKKAWRAAHPNVVRCWYDLERAAITAVRKPGTVVTCGKISFWATPAFLYMQLPSKRLLSYPAPRIVERSMPWDNAKKRDALTYCSTLNPSNVKRVIEDEANGSGWGRIQTYGGAIFENAVQAIARDIMAEAMLRIEDNDYEVVMTIHDEVVAERKQDYALPDLPDWDFKYLMEQNPAWANGLPIVAKGWHGSRYRKD